MSEGEWISEDYLCNGEDCDDDCDVCDCRDDCPYRKY